MAPESVGLSRRHQRVRKVRPDNAWQRKVGQGYRFCVAMSPTPFVAFGPSMRWTVVSLTPARSCAATAPYRGHRRRCKTRQIRVRFPTWRVSDSVPHVRVIRLSRFELSLHRHEDGVRFPFEVDDRGGATTTDEWFARVTPPRFVTRLMEDARCDCYGDVHSSTQRRAGSADRDRAEPASCASLRQWAAVVTAVPVAAAVRTGCR